MLSNPGDDVFVDVDLGPAVLLLKWRFIAWLYSCDCEIFITVYIVALEVSK